MAQLNASSGGFSIKRYLPRFMRRRDTNFSRQHARHDCVMPGAMHVVEIGAEFDGVVVEISRGGCTFRPTTMYLLDRTGEHVAVSTEYFTIEGRIRSARPDGYGIQFYGEVNQMVVEQILSRHGGKIGASFLGKRNARLNDQH